MRRLILMGLVGLTACSDAPASAPQSSGTRATAVFAGGCFWCTESDFDRIPGVLATTSGYSGGSVRNPTYEQVSGGDTGHIEVVRVTYDPSKIGFGELVRRFLRTVDVVDGGGQFCDRGPQYRSAIFVSTPAERAAATTAIRQASAQLNKKIATEILPAAAFWPAEAYHQDYYRKNPVRYKFYRWNCGRDQRLRQLWRQ